MTRPMTVDELFTISSGAPIYFNQNSTVGDMVEGEVTEATAREKTVYKSVPPVVERWDDGTPKYQIVVTLQTNLRDRSIDNDDGKRRVFLRWYGTDRTTILDAVKAAGDSAIRVGAWMRVTYKGLGQAAPGFNAPNVYAIEYRAAGSVETLMTKPAPSSYPQGVSYSQGGVVTGTASSAPPADYQANIPEQRSAVSDARQTQQTAAASGDERREMIGKVQKLARAGFGADEISGMVTLSREAIEAILAVG